MIEIVDSIPGTLTEIEELDEPAKTTERVVIGTDKDTGELITRPVREVLTITAASAAAADAQAENNDAFSEAVSSALTFICGSVDFHRAFDNAVEEIILVPVDVQHALPGMEYTVIYENGETVTLRCENPGELMIPFPREASGISFAVQDDFPVRYAFLIENYLKYGEGVLEGRTPETQARVRAYAEELQKLGLSA